MKYFIGIVILLSGIYIMIDLALKTRYTRKRLSKGKNKPYKFHTTDQVNRFIFVLRIKSYFSFIFSLFFGQSN